MHDTHDMQDRHDLQSLHDMHGKSDTVPRGPQESQKQFPEVFPKGFPKDPTVT